jgi:class 3 adenylate cyclase/tetratricopeptide (TPR) repeat protein
MNTQFHTSLLVIGLLLLTAFTHSQEEVRTQLTIDSLRQVIAENTADSTIIKTWIEWESLVRSSNPDTALTINKKIISFCNRVLDNKEVKSSEVENYQTIKANSLNRLGFIYTEQGDHNQAFDLYNKALKIFETYENELGIAESMSALGNYHFNTDNYPKALSLFKQSKRLFEKLDDDRGVAKSLSGMGLVNDNQGNYAKAIQYYLQSLEILESLDEKSGMAQILNNIGVLHFNQNDYPKALEYHQSALEIRKELGSKYGIGQSLNNIGLVYELQEDYDKAFEYYKEALEINKEANNKSGVSYSLTNLGIANYWKKDYKKSIDYHLQSLAIRKEMGDKSGVASSFHDIAITYKDLGDCNQTINYCNDAIKIAKDIGYLEIQGGVLLTLYECHKILGNQSLALKMYEDYIVVKDSLENKANQREVLKQELTYTYEKQALADSLQYVQDQQLIQSKLKAKKQQSYYLLGGLALALLFLGFIFKQKKLVESERDKSDKLLLNILPVETARELKENGAVEAKSYRDTSILFTDFIGFSSISEEINPKVLLNELNHCFSAFDTIMKKHGIEKIKTIGDAYMAVAGVPNKSAHHAEDTIKAALEINRFMLDYIEKRKAEGLPYFECRIGVNSGPLIAGVVGTQKFQYDVWGDAVNIASRMESKGESGRVNISGSTYRLLKNNPKYTFESRGEILVKGDRKLEMYFISEKN